MPELPEVESVRRQLDPRVAGRRIVDVWWDEIPAMPRQFHDVGRLPGRTVTRVGRRGKFLICSLDGGLEMVLHLGMTGALRFDAGDDPHARARLWLDDGSELAFRDVRRFGRLVVVDAGDYSVLPTLRLLGPEPLSDEFDADTFARALASTSSPVKPFLLAQRAVAGIGNIYADEALWLARIHPLARRVGARRARVLHAAIRQVMSGAVEREGTTFRDYRTVAGDPGRNASFLEAYGGAGRPCRRCGRPLRRILVAGRGTTYCPACQRR